MHERDEEDPAREKMWHGRKVVDRWQCCLPALEKCHRPGMD